MRARIAALLALLAAAAFATAAGAAGTTAKPALRLLDRAPVRVRGTAFRAHERVRVVLSSTGRKWTIRTRTSAAGAFAVSFSTAALDRCSDFFLHAYGAAGDSAQLHPKALPLCPPE